LKLREDKQQVEHPGEHRGERQRYRQILGVDEVHVRLFRRIGRAQSPPRMTIQFFVWLIGQSPGMVQGIGLGTVVAAASGEAGPSILPTTAVTRQRYEVEGCKPPSAKLGPKTLPTGTKAPSVPARETW
jgi:hypothetical protein